MTNPAVVADQNHSIVLIQPALMSESVSAISSALTCLWARLSTIFLSEFADTGERTAQIRDSLSEVGCGFALIPIATETRGGLVSKLTKRALHAARENNVPIGLMVEQMPMLDSELLDDPRIRELVRLIVMPKEQLPASERFPNLDRENVWVSNNIRADARKIAEQIYTLSLQ